MEGCAGMWFVCILGIFLSLSQRVFPLFPYLPSFATGFRSVHGEFQSWDSLLAVRNEGKGIINPSKDSKVITKDAPNTVPDQILLQGTVNQLGVQGSIDYRGDPPFPGMPNM
jgi:hypothetical protein